jgi:hypothetical protein
MTPYRPWLPKKFEGIEAEKIHQEIVGAQTKLKWLCRINELAALLFFLWVVGHKIMALDVMNLSRVGIALLAIPFVWVRILKEKMETIDIEQSVKEFYSRISTECWLLVLLYVVIIVGSIIFRGFRSG